MDGWYLTNPGDKPCLFFLFLPVFIAGGGGFLWWDGIIEKGGTLRDIRYLSRCPLDVTDRFTCRRQITTSTSEIGCGIATDCSCLSKTAPEDTTRYDRIRANSVRLRTLLVVFERPPYPEM